MKRTAFVLSALLPLFFSCSLDYGNNVSVKDKVPEFVFKNIHFTRYENSKKSMEMNCDNMEQYANDKSCYAKRASFVTMDESGQTETSGRCNLLAIDTKKEIYSLYEKIHITNNLQKMEIIADNLKWNAKTEELASGIDDYVELVRDDVQIYGKGFSASSVDFSFRFNEKVSGTIDRKEEQPVTDPLPEEAQ